MVTTPTTQTTIQNLCKSIVTRLENSKAIVFPPRLRQVVAEDVFRLISPGVKTEQDLHESTISSMGARSEQLADTTFTESAQYKAARAVIRKSYGDDELNGLYFQKSLKWMAQTISQYLMRSSYIEDVFETDEQLEQMIVDIVRRFNPAQSA